MRHTKLFPLLILFGLISIAPSALFAQALSCEAYLEDALAKTAENCADAANGEACYGYGTAQATTFADSANFSSPSDTIEIVDVESFETIEMDLLAEQYGTVVLNVPTPGGQIVKMVAMGQVTLTNAINPTQAAEPTEPVDVTVNTRANLRNAPDSNAAVITAVDVGAVLRADGVDASGRWVRVGVDGGVAWIFVDLVDGAVDLPVVVDGAQAPFGTFFFSAAPENDLCRQGLNALLIQVAPDAGEVTLVINGTPTTITGTVILEAASETEMQMTVLDGRVETPTAVAPLSYVITAPMEALNSDASMMAVGDWGSCSLISGYDRRLDGLTALNEILYTPISIPQPGDTILACGTPEQYEASVARVQQNAAENARAQACQGFAITSPLDGVPQGDVTFTWTPPAEGATSYRLNIFGESGDFRRAYTTQGAELNVTANTSGNASGVGPGQFLSFTVDSLDASGNVACTTAPVRLRRVAPGEDAFATATPTPDPDDDDE